MKRFLNGQISLGVLSLSLVSFLIACQSVPKGNVTEEDRLQGYWEGVGAGGDCSITFEGNTIDYRAGANWYKTTFKLVADTDPQQLRATIIDCNPENDFVGKVVFVVYKIEDETLTLTTYGESDGPPKTFEGNNNLYIVKRVDPQKRYEPIVGP